MESKHYDELYEEIKAIRDKLKNCETIVSDYSEQGDITQTFKIREVRHIIENWLSLLIENY